MPVSVNVLYSAIERNYDRGYAASVQLPSVPLAWPARGARTGVRLRPGRVQRRTARPAGRARGRAAVPHRRRTLGAADRGQSQPGAGLARRGVRGGAPAGPGGPERGVPELLRLDHGPAEGAEG